MFSLSNKIMPCHFYRTHEIILFDELNTCDKFMWNLTKNNDKLFVDANRI